MANTTGTCANAGCNCTVQTGQSYCSDYCQQQAQRPQSRQQTQQGASKQQAGSPAANRCDCGHSACRY